MTRYELYIEGRLCDLSSDEDITLVYQSGLFVELDGIQSNRSYNIDLPITPRNAAIFGQVQRPDADSDAPYVKMRAALYRDGAPLFTSGFAVITGVSEVISVTLTWGNVDNFDPLFDSDMSDLAETLYDMGIGSVPWNKDSKIVEMPAEGAPYPYVGFYGIDFGQGLGNPKYLHPSIRVDAVIEAIERYNGITIEGKERLYGDGGTPDIMPCVTKKGDKISWRFEALVGTPNIHVYTFIWWYYDSGIRQDPHNLAGSREMYSRQIVDIEDQNITTVYLDLEGPGGALYFIINTPISTYDSVTLSIRDGVDDFDYIELATITSYLKETDSHSDVYYFSSSKFQFENIKSGKLRIEASLFGFDPDPNKSPWTNCVIRAYCNWDRAILYPSIFPVGVNLPDMSQGDFMAALLTRAGLFAYADAAKPDTISVMSADDILTNVQEDNIDDWSRKVILGELHRVDMPSASEFEIDDYARKNTLDYDNDDDVETDTHGEILIDNINLDPENELAELPFSASENTEIGDIVLARVPAYEKNSSTVTYNAPSDRILEVYDNPSPDGKLRYLYGIFNPRQRFGGPEGIVATKYKGLQDILRRLRIITVEARLTAIDLMRLDYRKPVYIAQFGRLYAIYSVETSEGDICECRLIELPADAAQYLMLYDADRGDWADNLTLSVPSAGGLYRVRYKSSGTPEIGTSLVSTLQEAHIDTETHDIVLEVGANTTDREVRGPVWVRLQEKESIQRMIAIRQAIAYRLLLDGRQAVGYDEQAAQGVTLSVSIDTNGTPYIMEQDERLDVAIEGQTLRITVPANETAEPVVYRPVKVGISEDAAITASVAIRQKGFEAYFLLLDGRDEPGYELSSSYMGGILSLVYETNGTIQITNTDDRLRVSDTSQSIDIEVPANNSAVAVVYSTIEVRLAEDPAILKIIRVTQAGISTDGRVTLTNSAFRANSSARNLNLITGSVTESASTAALTYNGGSMTLNRAAGYWPKGIADKTQNSICTVEVDGYVYEGTVTVMNKWDILGGGTASVKMTLK